MICWETGCRGMPIYRVSVVFRKTADDETPYRVPLHTSLCETHADSISVQEVLDSGIWDQVLRAIKGRSKTLPRKELTKLELEIISVGEC